MINNRLMINSITEFHLPSDILLIHFLSPSLVLLTHPIVNKDLNTKRCDSIGSGLYSSFLSLCFLPFISALPHSNAWMTQLEYMWEPIEETRREGMTSSIWEIKLRTESDERGLLWLCVGQRKGYRTPYKGDPPASYSLRWETSVLGLCTSGTDYRTTLGPHPSASSQSMLFWRQMWSKGGSLSHDSPYFRDFSCWPTSGFLLCKNPKGSCHPLL